MGNVHRQLQKVPDKLDPFIFQYQKHQRSKAISFDLRWTQVQRMCFYWQTRDDWLPHHSTASPRREAMSIGYKQNGSPKPPLQVKSHVEALQPLNSSQCHRSVLPNQSISQTISNVSFPPKGPMSGSLKTGDLISAPEGFPPKLCFRFSTGAFLWNLVEKIALKLGTSLASPSPSLRGPLRPHQTSSLGGFCQTAGILHVPKKQY